MMHMRIRPEQMEEFESDRRTDFKRRLVKHLRKHHVEKTKPHDDPEMMAICEKSIEQAKKYDLTTEQSIACFAQLQWLLGFNFESRSVCRFAVDILNDTEVHQNNRAKIALALAYQFHSRGIC